LSENEREWRGHKNAKERMLLTRRVLEKIGSRLGMARPVGFGGGRLVWLFLGEVRHPMRENQ
jgi:hypothetical protein